MLSYDDVKDKDCCFRPLTGLDKEDFEKLLPYFKSAWEEYLEEKYINKRKRRRKYGGGRKPVLRSIEDKMFFILFYFKTYPLQSVAALTFGISQSQICEWIHRLSEIFRKALAKYECLPERDTEKAEQGMSECSRLIFAIDGTERRRQRPKDKEEQKKYYSGKKSPYF